MKPPETSQEIGHLSLTKPLRPAALAPPADEYWSRLGVRIAIAGGFYPVAIAGTWGVLAGLAAFFSSLTSGDYMTSFATVIAFAVIPAVAAPIWFAIGFICAGMITLFVVPLAVGFSKLFGLGPPRDRFGMTLGAVVAYLGTLPAWLIGADNLHDAPVVSLATAGVHLAPALAFGQAAGAWASIRDLRRRRRGRWLSSKRLLTLWTMLAGMVPLSLLLAVLKMTRLLTSTMAIATLAALVCGLATHWLVVWLVNRRADRRMRLRRERRLAERST